LKRRGSQDSLYRLDMAMSLQRSIRRFQFSVLTVFVVVTAIAVVLGREVRFVKQRQAMLDRVLAEGGEMTVSIVPPPPRIPIWREWLGDESVYGINVPPGFSDVNALERLFPESVISETGDGPTSQKKKGDHSLRRMP
jgi:hypothetical protein